MKRLWLFALVVLATLTASAQPAGPNLTRYREEMLRHYRALIQIDTSAPPGNETKAVEYLKRIIEAEGIATKTFAVDPTRANLVARIKGNGSKRPLLLMAHTDVVGVQREKWPVDPFGAVMKDGYVWGRGSVDDKPILAANLMVFLILKRSGAVLDRDIIFFAESGEEGESQFGAEFMAKEHYDEIDAEFALTEGGGARLEGDRVTSVTIETTEKRPIPVRLVVNGISGHASVPRVDNAVAHLAAAVGKVAAWETPMRLNDTTRTYFEKLATISTQDRAARYNALMNPRTAAEAQRYLAINEPSRYSMLRTSVVPTIIKGGFRTNVIPSEAEATIDIRALPDEDTAKFYEELRKIVNDPAVRIEPTGFGARPLAAPSRLDSDMYKALETATKRLHPGAVMMPTMSTGATDMAFLRAKGMQCYGVGPASTDDDGANYGAHSDVERLRESSLYEFLDFLWVATNEVAVRR